MMNLSLLLKLLKYLVNPDDFLFTCELTLSLLF